VDKEELSRRERWNSKTKLKETRIVEDIVTEFFMEYGSLEEMYDRLNKAK